MGTIKNASGCRCERLAWKPTSCFHASYVGTGISDIVDLQRLPYLTFCESPETPAGWTVKARYADVPICRCTGLHTREYHSLELLSIPLIVLLFKLADSTRKCNRIVKEYLKRCTIGKRLSNSMIEFLHHSFQMGLSDVLKTGILRKVLSQQPIGIFIGAPFPCGIGMGKVEGQV